MGKRADFYLGRGMASRYAGSLTHDADPAELQNYFEGVRSEPEFLVAVAETFKHYDYVRPEFGWPWPWKDSNATDTAICFYEGRVWSRHWSGRWAPLARYNRPGRVKARFPSMTRQPNTPESRLRERIFRSSAVSCPLGTNDVLAVMLVRTAFALTRFWMHVHESGEQVFRLEPSDHSRWLLRRVLEVLAADPGGIEELVARRQLTEPSPAWGLLLWALGANKEVWSEEDVLVPYDCKQSMYFGLPAPGHIPLEQLSTGSINFKVVNKVLYQEGQRHLEQVWLAGKFVYPNAALAEFAVLTGKSFKPEKLAEFSFFADASTAENRALVRNKLGQWFWSPESGPCD